MHWLAERQLAQVRRDDWRAAMMASVIATTATGKDHSIDEFMPRTESDMQADKAARLLAYFEALSAQQRK